MTKLEREVRRMVRSGRHRFAVTLAKGNADEEATIEVRLARTREGHAITVEGLYRMLAERAVVKRKAAKRGARGVSLLTGRAR